MVHFCKLPLAGPFCFSIILYNEPPSGSMNITTNEYINAKINGIKSYRFKALQSVSRHSFATCFRISRLTLAATSPGLPCRALWGGTKNLRRTVPLGRRGFDSSVDDFLKVFCLTKRRKFVICALSSAIMWFVIPHRGSYAKMGCPGENIKGFGGVEVFHEDAYRRDFWLRMLGCQIVWRSPKVEILRFREPFVYQRKRLPLCQLCPVAKVCQLISILCSPTEFFFEPWHISTAHCTITVTQGTCHCLSLVPSFAKVAPGVFRSFSPSRRGNWPKVLWKRTVLWVRHSTVEDKYDISFVDAV